MGRISRKLKRQSCCGGQKWSEKKMRNYSCLHTEEVSAKPGEQEAPEEKVCGILSEIKYGKMAENHEPRPSRVRTGSDWCDLPVS